ncbi:DUF983 domain-containing protein [Aquibaculum sediminis]|uniref:DUF983 domain-containing protein n=1 Tax=Aquibaculum sediminis TaxID=3231907 RepID=UPI003456BC5A
MTTSSHHAGVSPLAAGLSCRCPRCGQGRLFDGFLTVQDHCERCGLDLKSADSGDGPAVFLIFILGFLVVPSALLLESWVSPPLWAHALLWGVVILGGAIAMLRPFKATMIALQYRHKASDSGSTRYDP